MSSYWATQLRTWGYLDGIAGKQPWCTSAVYLKAWRYGEKSRSRDTYGGCDVAPIRDWGFGG